MTAEQEKIKAALLVREAPSSPAPTTSGNSNSGYTMTKTSQNWFRHSLPQPADGKEVEERFSIALWTIEKPKRKILLVGDSNTGKMLTLGRNRERLESHTQVTVLKQAKLEKSNITFVSGILTLKF